MTLIFERKDNLHNYVKDSEEQNSIGIEIATLQYLVSLRPKIVDRLLGGFQVTNLPLLIGITFDTVPDLDRAIVHFAKFAIQTPSFCNEAVRYYQSRL
jgi:hypothetical protein